MRELRKTVLKNAKVVVYDECKYTMTEETVKRSKTMNYEGLTYFYIVTEEDATLIESETDGSCIDDYHEYLELHFEDGSTATFRNSYCDLFCL